MPSTRPNVARYRALLLLAALSLWACKRDARSGSGSASASGSATGSAAGSGSGSAAGSGGASGVSHKLPLIDSHVHLTPIPRSINRALRIFSQVNVVKFAVKSAGRFGTPRFEATAHYANNVLGENMAFFANLDWEGIDDKSWGQREADR
ncbi:MAG: hypothetical protein KC503_14490, partial [Myxococcales bacterium]|nr:hypothetical protein [Myxococcales bacterium]